MKRGSILAFLALTLFSFDATTQTKTQETKLTWFGHAAFCITTPNGKVLLIDPWMRNPANPEVKADKDPLAAITKVDYLRVTHEHRDHVGNAIKIARKTGAFLIANPELERTLVKLPTF